MKNKYVAIGCSLPEVGFRLGGFDRLSVENGSKVEQMTSSSEIVSVKQLIEFVWLVNTKNSTYLFLNRSIADKNKDHEIPYVEDLTQLKVIVGVADSVPKSRSNTLIRIMTGINTCPVREVMISSPVCNRVKGNRDVYYVESGDKLYIVFVNTR